MTDRQTKRPDTCNSPRDSSRLITFERTCDLDRTSRYERRELPTLGLCPSVDAPGGSPARTKSSKRAAVGANVSSERLLSLRSLEFLYRCPHGGEHVPARIFLPRLQEIFLKDFDASRICRRHNRMSALRQRGSRGACASFLSDFIKRECVICRARQTLRTQDSPKISRWNGLLRSDYGSRMPLYGLLSLRLLGKAG